MTAKRRQTKMQTATTLLQQCRQLPGTVRLACEQAARGRYQRHYHPSLPNRRQHMIVDALLGLTVAAALAAVLFIGLVYQRSATRQQIDLVMQAQATEVVSGDTLSVAVSVANNGRADLLDAYLLVPATSSFIAASERVDLGTIRRGKTGGATLTGLVIGDAGSAARLHAVLRYRLDSVSGEQEKLVSQAVFINESRLALSVDAPESIALQQPFPFTIVLRNSAEQTHFANVFVMPTVPPGFEIIESLPAADPATNAWSFDGLGALQTATIRGFARVTVATQSEARLTFKAYAAPSGLPYLQAQTELVLPVFNPRVSAQIISAPSSLRLGETAQAILRVTNNESAPLRNARLHVHASADVIAADAYPAGQWQDGYFVIAVGDVAALGASDAVIPLIIRPNINAATVFGAGEVGVSWRAELHYDAPSETAALDDTTAAQPVTVQLPQQRVPLVSDLSVSAFSRYTSAEREAIGTGPWPPREGERSTVWVFVSAHNNFNPLQNAVITAQLGAGVRFTGRQSVTAGQALTISDNGALRWSIGAIPDYKSRFDGAGISAAVEVEIVLDADAMANGGTEQAILIGDITVAAYDAVARQNISVEAADIRVAEVLN